MDATGPASARAAPTSSSLTAKILQAPDAEQRAMTSMRVFREFIKRSRNRDGVETIDASAVISRECYDLWVNTRKQLPPNPEKAFQRSLSAHVTGVDGRIPFTPSEEAAVLKVLRRKERWPCFEQSSTRFGLMGFRAKGYHEKSGESGEESPYGAQMKKRLRSSEDDDEDDDYATDEGNSVKYANQRVAISALTGLSPIMPPYFPPSASIPNTGLPLRLIGSKPEDFLFTPQIPVVAPASDAVGGFSFLDTAKALLNRFHGMGVDAWSTILSIGRMLLVSKGWSAAPSMEDAERLIREYEIKYPCAAVIALDLTTRSLKDRVMALSPAALSYLGPVARNQNGLDRRLIPLNEAWPTLTTAFSAYKNPGVEMSTKLSILCKDNILRPAMCYFCMHPTERLLILRAEAL